MGLEALVGPLLRASVQGALAVALVWLVCRLVPRLPAGVRCGLWWLACGRLLLALVWAAPVPLGAAWPRAGTVADGLLAFVNTAPPGRLETVGAGGGPAAAAGPALLTCPGTDCVAGSRLNGQSVAAAAAASPRPAPRLPRRAALGRAAAGLPWPLLLVLAWGAGVLAQLALAAAALGRVRAVVRRAVPVAAPEVVEIAAELARRLGIGRRVAVLASLEIGTPQVVGPLRPRVLLPAAALRLGRDELAMTLCHELAHVRRGDLWLGWVPALARRLFFFHPLARLAAREYALAREAACDAAVLRLLGPAPAAYGRLLLRLGVAPRPPRWAAAGAAPTFRILKRRLEMLQHATDAPRFRRAWWLAVAPLALAVLVPFTMAAAGEEPAAPAPAVAAVAQAAPTPALAAVAPALAGSTATAHAVAAPAAVAVVAPRLAHAAAERRSASATESGFAYAFDEDEPVVILYGNGTTTIHGTRSDLDRAREHLGGRGPGIWFARDGVQYVVRDAATVAAARELFAPQAELGHRQAELGARQAELGGQQAALGRRQAEMAAMEAARAARQGELAAQQAELAARLAAASPREREEMAQEAARLAAELAAAGRRLGEEGAQLHAELAAQQAELGRRQAELGARQAELGRRQAEAALEVQRGLRELLDRAIASGATRRVE